MHKLLAILVCLVVMKLSAGSTVKRYVGEYRARTHIPPGVNDPYQTHRPSRPQYGGRDSDSYPSANYQYKYDVEAPEYGTRFGHQEARQGEVVQGRYYVLLPDGRTQTVDYVADQYGYRPKISYQGGGGQGGTGGYSRGGVTTYQGAGGQGGAEGYGRRELGYQGSGGQLAAGGYERGGRYQGGQSNAAGYRGGSARPTFFNQ